jgi:hypothetical protein
MNPSENFLYSSLMFKFDKRKNDDWSKVSSYFIYHSSDIDPEDFSVFTSLTYSRFGTVLGKFTMFFGLTSYFYKQGIPKSADLMLKNLALVYVLVPFYLYFTEKETFVNQTQQILVYKYLKAAEFAEKEGR